MFDTFSVIGGDLRQLTLARLLEDEGRDVLLYGFEKNEAAPHCVISPEAASQSDIIILPVPVSFDGVHVNMPFAAKELETDVLIDLLNPASLVLGGQIKPSLARKLSERGIAFRDYLLRDELSIRNAIPTAEGAIEIAVSETPITLHGSKVLVTGYGKIGKILSGMLRGMGAKTYVEARKYADLALIEGHGCVPVALSELSGCAGEFDIIFNTVPALLFTEEILSKIKKDALIIDLASRPGGVDFEAAKRLGIKVIWALSLPGKVAPVTSGIIIKDTIMHIISEMGV